MNKAKISILAAAWAASLLGAGLTAQGGRAKVVQSIEQSRASSFRIRHQRVLGTSLEKSCVKPRI